MLHSFSSGDDVEVSATEGNVAVIPCDPPTGHPTPTVVFQVNSSSIDTTTGEYSVCVCVCVCVCVVCRCVCVCAMCVCVCARACVRVATMPCGPHPQARTNPCTSPRATRVFIASISCPLRVPTRDKNHGHRVMSHLHLR